MDLIPVLGVIVWVAVLGATLALCSVGGRADRLADRLLADRRRDTDACLRRAVGCGEITHPTRPRKEIV